MWPSGKLTWQLNIPIFTRKYIFNWPIFHCYVSLPGCTSFAVIAFYFQQTIMLRFHFLSELGPCRRSWNEWFFLHSIHNPNSLKKRALLKQGSLYNTNPKQCIVTREIPQNYHKNQPKVGKYAIHGSYRGHCITNPKKYTPSKLP